MSLHPSLLPVLLVGVGLIISGATIRTRGKLRRNICVAGLLLSFVGIILTMFASSLPIAEF